MRGGGVASEASSECSVIASLPLLSLLVACRGEEPTPTPEVPAPLEPGPLQVGVARARMPAPVGIGTAGYGGFTIVNETPFSELYPGTEAVFQHPDFEALAVSRGEGFTVVFLRTDTVGIFQQLRRAVVLEVESRTGQNLDDGLIIGATHTHSGPGRVVDGGGLYDLITDVFFPEFYDAMVDAMADVIVAALDDLAPGRLGTGMAYTDDGHEDRRCEDGRDHVNGALPIVALEREGEVVGVLLTYAVHGTVLGIEEFTLSQDVSGGIEQAVEDRFDHPVTVAMFNAWGADMSPADPELPSSSVPSHEAQIAAVGATVADAVDAAMDGLSWTEEPEIRSRTFRVAIDREVLGYAPDEFPYEYGAVYCSGEPEDCDLTTTVDDLDLACLPFNADYPAPNQTELTAGRVGGLDFVTFPGEPGTLLAEQVLGDLRDAGASGDIAFFGYAQDYLGYSILEDDWWQGGYEASGALWGPRQGEYLAARVVEAWTWAHGHAEPPADLPAPIAPFDDPTYDPYAPTAPVRPGTVATDLADLPSDAMAEFVVRGLDPWLGVPLATVIDEADQPLLRANGAPWTSDDLPFSWRLDVVPPYEEPAAEREFLWRLAFPTRHPVPGAALPLGGASLRVRVELPDGSVVTSAPFQVQ
jgi:hypothetical protein